MQVMPHHAGAHSKSCEHLFTLVCHAIVIGILELPEVGNAGQVECSIDRECREGDSVENIVHALGILGPLVGNPVTIEIFNAGNSLGNIGKESRLELFIRCKLLAPVPDGLKAEVSRGQCPFTPDVENPAAV